jgi:hypothetical protein
MVDDHELDELERYLARAPIIDAAAFANHGAHRSYRLILRGAVAVLAKPEDGIADDGPIVVGREVAAWTIARELGWADLLGVTVRREIASLDTGQPVAASLQILWPDVQPDAPTSSFTDEDIWRAAVFDAVVAHTDRNGHNWLLLPGSGASPPMLKLNDHGYGFASGLVQPSSSFYSLKTGQQIPEDLANALRRLADPRQVRDLEANLEPDALDGVRDRAAHLVETGQLVF